MKSVRTILLLAVLTLAVMLSFASATADDDITIHSEGSRQVSWTFLVYLDADNNLEDAGIDDFLEMASVGSSGNVNVVVQMDRIPGYATSYDNWTSTKRFLVTPGMTPNAANALQDIGEANMGDPQTLVDFVQWGMSSYPADRYALVLWDHGSGWRLDLKERPIKDVAYDDSSGGDALDMPELRGAMDTLSDGGSDPLDLVGFDACLMGMIEVDVQLVPFVEVRAGSEETEPWDGWPFDDILSALVANPAMSASDLGTVIVDEYYASYGNSETQSAVDLGAAYDDLVDAVNELAIALINGAAAHLPDIATARSGAQEFYYSTYIDLYDFAYQVDQRVSDAAINAAADAVMNAVNSAVIREQHGSSWPRAHGISIYFPESEGSYNATYDGSQGWLQFTADTQWDEWLHAFYGSPTACNDPYEPNDSRAQATGIDYGQTLTEPDICPAGDEDYYVFSGSAGDVIVADIDARSLSSASQLDSYLYLLDAYGSELTHNDDDDGLDSRIEYTLLANGTYYLKVREFSHPSEGGAEYFYTISLTLASVDVYSSWASSPPSLDGYMSAGEWSDAASYDIGASAAVRLGVGDGELDIVAPSQQSQLGSSGSPVTLYVMNDSTHLYLAFDNPNDTVYDGYDQAGIYFDDNPLPSDGQWTHTTCGHADGEGNFWVLPATTEFREIIAGPDYCELVVPATGVGGTLRFTSGHAQAEVAIDLTSSALRALPGNSINMRLWIYNYRTGSMDGMWPVGSVWNDPSTYQSLTLATGGAHPDIEVAPISLEVTLLPDQSAQRTMTIHNVGQGTLNFRLFEHDTMPASTALAQFARADWLSETPSSGTVPSGDSLEVTVTFDAAGLAVGTYATNILVVNNDPDENPVVVPVTLHVAEVNPAIVTLEDGNGSPGSADNPLTISADNQSLNTTPIAAGEFWVIYDGSIGLTLAEVDTTARSADFRLGLTLDDSDPSAVEAHIHLYSLSGATIAPGTGSILELLFDVQGTAQSGDSSLLSFSQVSLSDQEGQEIPADFSDSGQFTIGCAKDGDINDDGATDLSDLNPLVEMILHSPQPDPSLHPLDWWCRGDLAPAPDGDEQWNIFDLQRLVCIILGACDGDRGEAPGSRGENIVSIGEVYATPGTSGTFGIDFDNEDAINGVEVWFTYDSTTGPNVSDVATTSRTDGWLVGFAKDESDPSAVEMHIILYNGSGWAIEPGTGAILSVEYDVDAQAAGDSPLHITQVNLADAVGQAVYAKSQDGMFHPTGERVYLPLVIRSGN